MSCRIQFLFKLDCLSFKKVKKLLNNFISISQMYGADHPVRKCICSI